VKAQPCSKLPETPINRGFEGIFAGAKFSHPNH